MPASDLPSFSAEEVQSHASAKSCYVTLGSKVYDITGFLEDHPGGEDLILDHAGEDVSELMKDEISHFHSDAAYEILDDCFIGYLQKPDYGVPSMLNPRPTTPSSVHSMSANDYSPPSSVSSNDSNGVKYAATGMSSAEDLSKETDYTQDYKANKFLDLNKPLLMQVWFGRFSKDFYLEQVHKPRHYKGGASAPLFGNFLEPFSLTPWYVVPILWLPCNAVLTSIANSGLPSPSVTASYYLFGLCLWTLIEYLMHRGLFHVDGYLPDNRVFITLHFLLHGIHHYLPMDKLRLVMPPALFLVLAVPLWKLAHAIFYWDWYIATAVYSGGFLGYICYDMTHYFLHHKQLPAYYKELKKYHLQHHFADYQNGFGVTSRFWDKVFGTELQPVGVVKTQ